MKSITISRILLLFLLCSSCREMEQVIEIEFPPVEHELVVECYLEPGQPYRLMLTETKGYFEDLNACPFVRNAIVVISHNGIRDTLSEAFFLNNNCDPDDIIPYGLVPLLNADSTRYFNYGSNTLCPLDYSQPFVLEVWDTLNDRYITANTQFIPPVPITTFVTDTNETGKAFCLFGTKDDPSTVDYYRMMMHRKSLTKSGTGSFPLPTARNPQFDRVIDDGGIFNGNDVLHGTNYKYNSGDTLIGTIYHIEKMYHDYLETTRDAESANGSPFGQPATITTNIQGGKGIFTFLSFTRDTLYVP